MRANAAFNDGNVEGFLDVFDPEATLVDLENAPDQRRVVRGRDAIREAAELWYRAFDELRAEIERSSVHGNHVLCLSHWVGKGRGSGIEIDVRHFDLYEFRGERCVVATLGLQSEREALDLIAARAIAAD